MKSHQLLLLLPLLLPAVARAQPPPPVACKLAAPLAEPPAPILKEDFEAPPAGVTGEHRYAPGHAGQAVILAMPDGRCDVPLAQPRPMPAGTIEWWVKPRPAAQVWSDQGWHYFLHAAPAQAGGVRLDLSRSPATQLQLSASRGETVQSLQIKTSSADREQWHHLLISWDFSGEQQTLWLMLDGVGGQTTFARCFEPPTFASLQFGNTPAGADIPLLPMDGALDEVRVSAEPVLARLVRVLGE